MSASILVSHFDRIPTYQLASFDRGIVARLNTKSGAIELCGVVETVLDLMPHGLFDEMSRAGMAAADIQHLVMETRNRAITDRCFEINNGGDHVHSDAN